MRRRQKVASGSPGLSESRWPLLGSDRCAWSTERHDMRPYWNALGPLWAAHLRASHFLLTAILGLALVAGPLAGIPNLPVIPGAGLFLLSLVLALVPSFIRANVELHAKLSGEIDHLHHALAARPKLVFDFVEGWPYRYLPGDQRCCYRVRLRNAGSATAQACRVVIVEADDAGLIDAALHWSQAPDYQAETVIDLPPDVSRLSDLVATRGEPPSLSWQVVGARRGNETPVRNGYRHQVTLRAEAQNAQQHPQQTFEVYMDGDRAVDLRMRMVARP
jgi:hypothetical protein